MQKLFGTVSELELIFSTENPIEIMIKSKTRGLIFLVCTEFPIENLGVSSENFSNNFCTFHAVSDIFSEYFSKFWILRLLDTFPTLHLSDFGQLFKMIDEKH